MSAKDLLATRFPAAFIAALGAFLGAMALPALAEDTLRGKANIVDGDTIDIAGIPIRLQGIDAPEQLQKCTSDGGQVACGKLATKALANMIGSAPVTCVLLGKDNYDRLLGECSSEGQSLNARMVRDGWALAFVKYSERYIAEEKEARAARYARVIEIPTPRWTAYDRVKFNIDLPEDIPLKTQERAYSSPIWYTPNG